MNARETNIHRRLGEYAPVLADLYASALRLLPLLPANIPYRQSDVCA
jgi:hypothetical protein